MKLLPTERFHLSTKWLTSKGGELSLRPTEPSTKWTVIQATIVTKETRTMPLHGVPEVFTPGAAFILLLPYSKTFT